MPQRVLPFTITGEQITFVNTQDIDDFANKYGGKKDEWPNMYLRLSLNRSLKSFSFWQIIIEKIERKLSTWSSHFTSKGRSLALIQATLSNPPTYYMSLYGTPHKGVTRIESLFRNCLWKDDTHFVRWNTINLTLDKGGLDLYSMKEKNRAILAKQVWRYYYGGTTLWRNLIKAKQTPTSCIN